MLRQAKRKARMANPAIKKKYLESQAMKMDKKPTSPEILFAQILKELKIEYRTQEIVGGKIFDFYIPSKNMLVETDGCYWHAKDVETKDMSKMQKKTVNNDKKKDVIAKGFGYLIERVWEDDLENDYENVKLKFASLLFS